MPAGVPIRVARRLVWIRSRGRPRIDGVGDDGTTRRPVVVVDDDDDDRFLFQRMLQGVDPEATVIEYAAADLALPDFLDDDRFHRCFPHGRPLVMLDINMPRMSGFEFLDVIAARREAQMDVVILTASDNPSDKERASSYAIVKGILVKPVSRAVLRALLDL